MIFFNELNYDPDLKKMWLEAITKPLKFIKVGKWEMWHNVNKVEKKKKKKKNKKNKKRIDSVSIQTLRPCSKKQGGSGELITNNNNNNKFLPELILFEILSRVPVESLMRFKSVCKSWCSSIEQDRLFINLHRARSKKNPRLFIVVPKPLMPRYYQCDIQPTDTRKRDFYLTADLDCHSKRASITTVCKTQSWIYDSISNPVNGLFCLSDSQTLYSVRIYNIGTRQVTPWIKSTLLPEEKEKEHIRLNGWYKTSFQLGFDPVTNEHKLVCLCHITLDGEGYNLCEVLTVGDSVWRRINDVPPYEVEGKTCIYVNGSIYWITRAVLDRYEPACIVAFDVGSEKFRIITIPDFVLNELDESYFRRDPYADLLQLDGRVVMLIRTSDYTVKLWVFGDYKDDDDINTDWTEVMTITLPFRWDGNNHIFFHTVEGIDDQIILRIDNSKEDASFYFYNLKRNTFDKFEIRGIPSSIPDLIFTKMSAMFFETLSPVNHK